MEETKEREEFVDDASQMTKRSLAKNGKDNFLNKRKHAVCKFCEKACYSRQVLLEHIRRIHAGGSFYICEVCNEGFPDKRQLLSHCRGHGERKNTRKTGQKGRRDPETRMCGIAERKVLAYCKICKCGLPSREALQEHIGRVHSEEKPFVCDVCSKRFPMKSDLRIHYRNHDKQRYVCGVCQKDFSSKKYLRIHHRLHTGEKPYVCLVCNRGFNQSNRLKEHLRVHTGERPFQCEMCDKRFARQCHLKVHIRVHTGERPFVCDVCHRGFSQKWVMYTHRRLHTGERPFECEICQKGFIYKSQLKQHRRTHVNAKGVL